MDWTLPADYLARLVRASAEPFAGAFSYYKGQRLTIWRARSEDWHRPSLAVPGQIVDRNMVNGEVAVAAGKDLLVLEQIDFGGSHRIPPTGVLKSLRDRLGILHGE